MSNKDYVATQVANHLQYRIAYTEWFDSLSDDQKRVLKAMGLDKYEKDQVMFIPKKKAKKKWKVRTRS